MDRACDYGSQGWGFDSLWAHFKSINPAFILYLQIFIIIKLYVERLIKLRKIVLSIGIIAGILVGLANAQTDGECKFCRTKLGYEEKKVEILKKELNLSTPQMEKIKEIEREKREAIKNFFKDYKSPIQEAIKDGKFEKEMFINTVKENAEKVAKIKADYIQKMLEILDDTQREKFLRMVEKRVKNFNERMKDEL